MREEASVFHSTGFCCARLFRISADHSVGPSEAGADAIADRDQHVSERGVFAFEIDPGNEIVKSNGIWLVWSRMAEDLS